MVSRLRRTFSVRPMHPVGEDGRMALSDHLREVRGRLMRIAVILIVGTAVCLVFYQQIFDLVLGPYNQAREILTGRNVKTEPTISGVGGPLMMYLKLASIAAVLLTSPLWLYQIWAFILPGLHPNERKWSRVFAAVAGPLFLVGVLVGYLTLPKGIEVLVGFTREGLTNLVDFTDYLSFFSRTLFVFGVSFEIPVFLVMLNLVGVLPATAIASYRSWFILGIFVFAAVATPSTDPFTMLFLALPMVGLMLIAEVICRVIDKRRARARAAEPSPDEASAL